MHASRGHAAPRRVCSGVRGVALPGQNLLPVSKPSTVYHSRRCAGAGRLDVASRSLAAVSSCKFRVAEGRPLATEHTDNRHRGVAVGSSHILSLVLAPAPTAPDTETSTNLHTTPEPGRRCCRTDCAVWPACMHEMHCAHRAHEESRCVELAQRACAAEAPGQSAASGGVRQEAQVSSLEPTQQLCSTHVPPGEA